MHYKLIIVDNNSWMYSDMAYQMISMLEDQGHTASLVPYEHGTNTDKQRYIFLGTAYRNVFVSPNSIVSNFDNDNILFSVITPEMMQTCTIWDYSKENLALIKSKHPQADCHLFNMGYTHLLNHHTGYDESVKDIDVLLMGVGTERRMKVLNKLSEKGYNVQVVYRKIGQERADLLKRTKVAISIYSSEHRHCISASRMTPILCNGGFIVTENCSNEEQNELWSQFTVSVDYENLYDTIVKYIESPQERKEMAHSFQEKFKEIKPGVV